jgi:ABC-type lipoprotein release transport system permease subunit
MPIGLLLFLAWRGLFQSRLIAILLCVAVAGGVAFQIPNEANLDGYEQEIMAKGVVVGSGDVRVRPRKGSRFDDGDALAASLATRAGVVAAVPALLLPGALGVEGNFKGALVMGLDATAPRLPYLVVEGTALAAGDDHGVVIGTALASRLGLTVGADVQLRIVFGTGWESLSPADELGRYTMTVRGLAAGSFVAPESIVVDRGFLTRELGAPHAASVILVHLNDHGAARAHAARLEQERPELSAVAWADDSPFLGSAIAASAAISIVSRAMVWLAVLMPVWALLYVHVLHRQRQIGVLGAVGIARHEVFAIHLTQAMIVGVIGALVGCVVGYALILWFGSHPIFAAPGFVVRPTLRATTFATPALLVLATTVLAGVVPAWRAARTDPGKILRGTT